MNAQVPVVQTENMAQVIERLAHDPTVDVGKLERMVELWRQIERERAEADFNDAMTTVQANMRHVAADADNPQTHSRYATYAALDRMLRPIYTEAGFSLSFNTLPTTADMVRVTCTVARAGYSREYAIDMPADGKGAKGGDVMTKTHATGSAVTYGMRYLLKMIFNVAIGEDDDDGRAAGMEDYPADWLARIEECVTTEELQAIADLLKKELLSKPAMNAIRAAWAAKKKGLKA